jgi:hypothetical protein
LEKKYILSSILLLFMMCADGGHPANAEVSGSTVHILLQDQALSVEVNGSMESLEVPARIEEGSFYIPIKWVAGKLGLHTEWNPDRRTVGLTTPKAYLEWNLERGIASANAETVTLQDAAVIRDGNLLVKLSWVAKYLEVEYAFKPNPGRVELTYVEHTDSAYKGSNYPEDNQPNSQPIAKFATDKAVYRIGESVKYIDLSYDPDAEGLPQYEWTGKEEAFFAPGTYSISLRVRDGKDNWSHLYTQTVTVKDEPYLTKTEFPWYTKTVGTLIKDTSAEWKDSVLVAPDLPVEPTQTENRKRLISGNNDVIEHTGLLSREQIDGKARLIAHHSNGMNDSVQFTTVLRNPSETNKITIHTTRAGKLLPTLFHEQLGREALSDFLTVPSASQDTVIEPGKTISFESYKMKAGQGLFSIADIETNGVAEVGFIVTKADEEVKPLNSYTASNAVQVDKDIPSSDIHLYAYAGQLSRLSKWTIGSGQDAVVGAQDMGKVYSLDLDRPRKMAIALQAKSGYVNGTVKVNGTIVPLPKGGLTDQDGAFLIYRSDGSGSAVHIEWMATPGSALPLQWIFVPLEEKN